MFQSEELKEISVGSFRAVFEAGAGVVRVSAQQHLGSLWGQPLKANRQMELVSSAEFPWMCREFHGASSCSGSQFCSLPSEESAANLGLFLGCGGTGTGQFTCFLF